MALAADNATDRVEQLILICEELAGLAAEETRRIAARLDPPPQADRDRALALANAYRLEMARIETDPSLIAAAPQAALRRLKEAGLTLQASAGAHRDALDAMRRISEGLLQAMAEEAARQRSEGAPYSADGAAPTAPVRAVAVDKRA